MTHHNFKKVTILGAARSGLAAARLLQSKNVRVFVSEIRAARDKQPEIEALKEIGVDFECGEHSEKIFEADFDHFKSGDFHKIRDCAENTIKKDSGFE